ncbi:glycosyltransferase family 2 protein [Cereibacter azotoformans]|uniref:Glycosyltransferase involved in cell wall biosynthesis n=1 Tax=Cereibacter azotoformans TaxID=43057 RepID=A0A2T5JSU1_9RHOB|nr:glycosyltransferase family 2 protein [Cereibacter azotoformans]PTR12073.1 glycosyltransferase involved in cell wall biosynthesis [Cereibacter azotoformans]
MTESHSPRIAILLATYNGAANLDEQLESLAAQHLRPAMLIVSDDGSTDGTRELVRAFAVRHSWLDLRLIDGPCQGSARNFLHLLGQVPEGIDMVALSDQDDVWLPDKLARGAKALRNEPADLPVLYGGSSWICDADLGNRRPYPLPQRAPGFRHALVQNIAGGNTMMLNRGGIELLAEASREPGRLVVHDWWIYQIVSGAGGRVIFDPVPLLLYRQHGGNLIGANHGLAAKNRRLMMMLSGRFRLWNAINIRALRASAHRFTPENRRLLEEFEALRRAGPLGRLRRLNRIGLYRQGLPGSLSLWLAAVLGRI